MKNIIPENTVSYTSTFKVGEKDIDRLDHVNNITYLQWVNDISEKHWNLLSSEALRAKYVWVVLRHELDYLNQLLLGDEVTMITWVGESGGAKSVRHVQMFKGESPLFKAKSTWCLIDAATLRPSRIKDDILEILKP